MLSDVEALSPSGNNIRSTTDGQKHPRRRRRFVRTYLPCAFFLVMAFLAYFYIDFQSNNGPDSKSAFSIQGTVETKIVDKEIETKATEAIEPTAPTLEPVSSAVGLTPVPTSNVAETDISEQKETSNNYNEGNKPKQNLVLHIGPQKTGSTTLQDAWSEPFGVLSYPLRMDNYRYRFIHPDQGFFNCDVSSYGGYQNCKASPKLKGLIRTSKKNGQNLLLSDENLDERFPEALREVIDDDDWDVTVIVMYRRIHTWLHSWYDQINKTTNKDGKGNILINEAGQPYRREHTEWPGEGGVEISTFSSWYKEFTRHWDSTELVGKHRSIAFKNAYEPYFNNIVVHNMHRDGDLVTNFMCETLPDAKHACGLLKKRNIRVPRDNQSVELDFDILAVEARKRGILKTVFKRKYVYSRIEKYVIENGKKIPRTCDMEMIDEIRQWLLDSEKEMFPEAWSQEMESYLRDDFEGYVASGKMCDIDFDQVFADKEWLNFFKSLDGRPRLILHIGPQKTGSTTLQHAWGAPQELKNIMVQDNFHYHYINPHFGTFDCDMIGDRWDNCKVSEKLKEILRDAKQNHKNLVLTDENLDHRFVGALREAINDDHFRVKVVLVYRRIHKWLPSWYSQINKTANKDSSGNLLRNANGQPERQPHTKWPADGGVHVPNFSDWYKKYTHSFPSSDLVSHHPSIFFKETYEPYFDNIQVFDMSQDGDLVTNFMCQMIPEAFRTCERLKQGTITVTSENPTLNLDHDIVSVQAYEHGLIDTSLSRPTVVEEVRKYVEEKGLSVPKICNENIRNEIHDWLLNSEKAMFPKAWSPQTSDLLDKSFNENYSKGKLCDVDVEMVLNDEDWIQFFSSLGKR